MVDETETSDSNFSSRFLEIRIITEYYLIKEIVEILKKKIETNLNFL